MSVLRVALNLLICTTVGLWAVLVCGEAHRVARCLHSRQAGHSKSFNGLPCAYFTFHEPADQCHRATAQFAERPLHSTFLAYCSALHMRCYGLHQPAAAAIVGTATHALRSCTSSPCMLQAAKLSAGSACTRDQVVHCSYHCCGHLQLHTPPCSRPPHAGRVIMTLQRARSRTCILCCGTQPAD